MDLEKEFKKETGYDAYIDNNLEPKIAMSYYVEWLESKVEELRGSKDCIPFKDSVLRNFNGDITVPLKKMIEAVKIAQDIIYKYQNIPNYPKCGIEYQRDKLNEAIIKAKPNMDKINDVDQFLKF